MRKVITILVLVMVAIVLTGLLIYFAKRPSPKPRDRTPTSEQHSSQPAYGDTIIEASIGDASYLNPILASDSASGDINGYVYNGLVKYDKNLKLVGELAESWDISEDGLVITFHLRKNVNWHDGEPFTSKDVKFTYEKLVNPNTRTPYASDYLMIDRLEIVDPYTVKIIYKEPFSPGLESWGMGIISQHIFEKGDFNNHPANRHPIGTGPYRFVEWKTDERIVLEANEDYFEGRPYIDRIIYRIVPDQAVQFLELRKGTIDTMGLTPDQFQKEAVSKEFLDKFNKFRYPSFGYTYFGYNLKNPLFKDKRVP
jgi:peptide/nickel transport system substrate-binding protein